LEKEAKMTNASHSIFDLLQEQNKICLHWFSLCARVLISIKKNIGGRKTLSSYSILLFIKAKWYLAK
jgi:hypothetical protein